MLDEEVDMEPMMTIHVQVDTRNISHVQNMYGKVTMFPLKGNIDSVFFKGNIVTGSSDVQTEDAAGICRSQAKIMMEGVDNMEKPCRLYMENNSIIAVGKNTFAGCPVFLSDSSYLTELLERPVYRTETQITPVGREIRVYSLKEVEVPVNIHVEKKEEEENELVASEEALEIMNSIYNHSYVKRLVFVGDMKGTAKIIDHPELFEAAGYLTQLSGSYQLLFMLNELDQMIALGYISGRVRDIEQDALSILLSVMKEYGKEDWFEKPISQYERYRIGR